MEPRLPIRETVSLCPVCRRKLPAAVFEADGAVYMEKECPDHGRFRPRIAVHGSHYLDLVRLYNLLSRRYPFRRDPVESCAFTTTLRCDSACPICFAGDRERIMPAELTPAEIAEKLDPIRGAGIMFKVHGGEPTLREDLPDIIRLVRKSGNYPVLVTNACRLDDFEYLKTLAGSGLSAVGMWFDTLSNDEIYRKMRGKPLLAQREKVVENIRLLGLKLLVFFVCVRGVNESELPDILEMAREIPEIYKVIVLAYMHRGSRGFSEDNEYTADETWDAVVDSTGVFSSLEDLYISLKINIIARAIRHRYQCLNSQTVLMPRSGCRKDGFDIESWRKIIERFEKMAETSPEKAKRYFLARLTRDLLGKGFLKPLADRYIFRKKELPDTFIPPGYFWLQFQTMYHPKNYDEDMVKNYCPFISFNPGLEKKISFCEYYNLCLKT